MPELVRWLPALLLALGVAAAAGTRAQRSMPLVAPLDGAAPLELNGLIARDVELSAREQAAAGMDDYLLREYHAPPAAQGSAALSLYVGYYTTQRQGRTIHSPKNCLPGAGWEALGSAAHRVTTSAGSFVVTHYLLQREQERAVVLYWYQGRGRVEANEYRVKWNLLRDAALRRRSDEALVRIVVPVTTTESDALALASGFAATTIPSLSASLPR